MLIKICFSSFSPSRFPRLWVVGVRQFRLSFYYYDGSDRDGHLNVCVCMCDRNLFSVFDGMRILTNFSAKNALHLHICVREGRWWVLWDRICSHMLIWWNPLAVSSYFWWTMHIFVHFWAREPNSNMLEYYYFFVCLHFFFALLWWLSYKSSVCVAVEKFFPLKLFVKYHMNMHVISYRRNRRNMRNFFPSDIIIFMMIISTMKFLLTSPIKWKSHYHFCLLLFATVKRKREIKFKLRCFGYCTYFVTNEIFHSHCTYIYL